MPPETEVIACPACRHVVRVPADWLGQTVQCPECKATFTAPRRDGEGLTESVLLTPSATDATPPASRRVPDSSLWLPAFAMMLLGSVSLVVNAMTITSIALDREQFEAEKRAQAAQMAKMLGQEPKQGEENPAANWPTLLGATIWGVVCGAATFGGGLAIATRRWYRLARLGSALAIVNIAGCCCVPGALVGIMTWTLLSTDEAREHFQRVPATR